MEQPKFRPLERFWPYADLPEQPTAEELAALDPDLHDALFGARQRPFSITIVFPPMDTADFPRALDLARQSAEFRETGQRIVSPVSRAFPDARCVTACATCSRSSGRRTTPKC